METICIGDLVLHVAPEQNEVTLAERTKPENTQSGLDVANGKKPTVGEVAQAHGWKVGRKEVRVVGHGEFPNHPVEVNGWKVMKPNEYGGIVPHDALDRVEILLDEGVEIIGLLIADDLRNHTPGRFRRLVMRATDRIRAIDWQKARAETARGISVITSACSAIAAAVISGVKRKADEVDWDEVKTVLGKILKVTAIAAVCIAGAIALLPILLIAAIPAALLNFDPWLLVIDSENRIWVIAEWWD